MQRTKLAISTAVVLGALVLAGCAKDDRNPVPPAGTRVTTTSDAFRQAARGLEGDCQAMGGCTCILDGFQTTCSLVFACLDAGFCELVRA